MQLFSRRSLSSHELGCFLYLFVGVNLVETSDVELRRCMLRCGDVIIIAGCFVMLYGVSVRIDCLVRLVLSEILRPN